MYLRAKRGNFGQGFMYRQDFVFDLCVPAVSVFALTTNVLTSPCPLSPTPLQFFTHRILTFRMHSECFSFFCLGFSNRCQLPLFVFVSQSLLLLTANFFILEPRSTFEKSFSIFHIMTDHADNFRLIQVDLNIRRWLTGTFSHCQLLHD